MKRMSGQYSLVNPAGVGGRPKPGAGLPDMPDMPPDMPASDAYRSPFQPGGHAGFVWSERAVPLAHILKDNTLPLVVKISAEASVRTEGESSMDFRQPLLLYREHLVSRLYARNLAASASGAGRKEVGPYVVIPQNYPGFFRPADQPARPVSTVSTVARLMPPSMLSSSPCQGYLCVSPLEGDVTYQKTSLEPGHYVIRDLLEEEIALVPPGGGGGGGGVQRAKRKKLVRCLRCVNEAGKGVLFPLKTSGQFLVAGQVDIGSNSRHQGLDNACRAYRWTQLTMGSAHNGAGPSAGAADGGGGGGGDGGGTKNNLNNKNGLEVVVDLIHGKPPPQECNFTGTLAFKHVTHDHTVIGCTTSEEKPRLFEMSPASKGPSFVLALNQDCFRGNGPLENCLKFVKQEMDRYVSEMKVRRDFEVESKERRESSS